MADLLALSVAQLAAGLVLVAGLGLLLLLLAGAHARGLERLERAGESIPWWLPCSGKETRRG